jgi:8-hydroxy-5-deazaflavin:NADPH oxidoreductase
MKIGLFGAGNVGGALGTSWVKAGHDVFFGVQDPAAKDTQALVGRLGSRARAGTLQEAASFGEVVVIALPWQAAFDAVPKLNLSRKVVIDCSNPPAALPGGAASGIEVLARLAPGARFAKAFNITGAGNIANPAYADGKLAMFFCGDDKDAKRTAESLIKATGFEAYDLGPLANARLMEAQAQLWISLAYKGGLGPDFGFRLVKR